MTPAKKTSQASLPDFAVHASAKVHESTSTSVFGDDSWEFDLAIHKPTASRMRLNYSDLTDNTKDLAKYLIWTTLNVDTPLEKLSRKASTRSRISVPTVRGLLSDLQPFLRWLSERPEQYVSQLDVAALEDYSDVVVLRPDAYESKSRKLFALTRLWLLSPYMPRRHQLIQPPWEKPDGMDELLGPAGWSAENKTDPIHPQTMSPLLIWSQRIVEDFSGDILAAVQLRGSLKARVSKQHTQDQHARMRQIVDDLRREGMPVPGAGASQTGKGIAVQYLAGKYGISADGLSAMLRASNLPMGTAAPLDLRLKGSIAGNPWRSAIDYYEVPELKRTLLTACLVVVAYLSGMRAEEVRALKRGCCTRTGDSDGAATYAITGTTFKGATDATGNLIPAGQEREVPWHVLSTVADAISIAESLHTDDLLFPHAIYGMKQRTALNPNVSITNHMAKTAIGKLVSWCNALAVATGRPYETIPKDPAGDLTIRRFRRTLAWFIYRLPGGRVALGVQYGHLHSYTSDGYGSRVSAGLRGLFPMEEAFSVADSLQRAVEESKQGDVHVSGPAAQRYVRGVQEYRDVYAGKVFGAKQAASLMRNPALRIYDSGTQTLACCYDPAKALCHPDRNPSRPANLSPDPTACDERCGNIARRDAHVQRIQESIDEMNAEIESDFTPYPIKQRLMQRRDSKQAQVKRHWDEGIDL